MKQQDLGLNLGKRRTRKAVFLDEMNLVVPWSELLALIAPRAPRAKTGRPPFELETMLRIHFVQQWFGLSDLAMEEALFETALYREFVGLSSVERIPDRVSILRFRHLLEEHQLAQRILATVNATLTDKGLMLREGTVVDATLIAAPSSTKNKGGERDPEMHQTKKGNQWHFGMKAHIGVDADSGLVHTVVGTAANVNDVTQASKLVHGDEADVFADAGYQGVAKREETQGITAQWHVAMRPGKRRALDKSRPMGAILDKLEQAKARIRAKVEHPFRVIKRQFGYTKVKYRGMAKNTANLVTLFALSNLWMARRKLLQGLHGRVRPQPAKGPAARVKCPYLQPKKRRIRHHVEYLDSVATATGVLNTILRLDCSTFATRDVAFFVFGAMFCGLSGLPYSTNCTLATNLTAGKNALTANRKEPSRPA